MKQLLPFFTLLIITSFNLQAQILWQNTIGGNTFDNVEDVINTSDGGFLIIGVSESNISGDKTENSRGSSDYWIVKTNNLGVVLWDKTFGGSGEDFPVSAIETSDGGFVIVGDSNSNMSGDKSENSNGGSDDEYRPYGFEKSSGGYVFAAETLSIISGDKSENSASNDIWLIELDSNGNLIADKTYGTNSTEYPEQILQTSDGNYVVVSSVDELSGDNTEAPNGDTDYWLFKVDKSTLSLNSIKSALKINIYPIPTEGYLNINSKSEIEYAEIFDITGKVISKIESPNKAINISELSKGMYLIKLSSQNKTVIKRIIKQ